MSRLLTWLREAQGVREDVGKFAPGAAVGGVLAGVGRGAAGVRSDGRRVLCRAGRGVGRVLRVAAGAVRADARAAAVPEAMVFEVALPAGTTWRSTA